MTAKLRIHFDNGIKGDKNWGCSGTIEGGLTPIKEYLEVMLDKINKDLETAGVGK